MFPIIMKTFPGFFLIFAVLKSGESLDCEICSRRGHMCSGRTLTCRADQQTCAAILIENTHLGKPQLTIKKTCERSRVCNPPLQSLNMGRGRYERTSVVCCIGEDCKSAAPRFQPGFIKPNGKSCPACFATSLSLCGSARVDCSGNEFHCMNAIHEMYTGGTLVTYYKRGDMFCEANPGGCGGEK
nr:phospholipase A2 inhibitor and Ly6/PLAUR domain-containing protein-like [Anolis sagrei ordinatus]